ncbi:IS66 family transposase ISSwo2 [bioreactor metagenome]|uniref:IS66 family transposase ISSwo2 n=1 Tax=bioreactor metagenome TaxID=1076179 RepID=A0A645BQR2_9ZZZZ
MILIQYQPSRAAIHPQRFLKKFNGLLHTDGYEVYHKLPAITVVGCWVHLRRKFEDALKAITPADRPNSYANEAIQRIGWLFHREKQAKELSAEKRYQLRLEETKPQAEAFFAWLQPLPVLPKTTLGQAVQYGLQQRQWLMNVYLDGRTEFSNNLAENAVRPFAVGRKNWLFCNTVKGAEASAVVYSLIETAKANGLKPFEYLLFLLETIPATTTGQLDDMLPWGKAIPEYCRQAKPVKEKA